MYTANAKRTLEGRPDLSCGGAWNFSWNRPEATVFRFRVLGFRVKGLGFTYGFGFMVKVEGCARVQGFGFRAYGSGFRAYRVQGVGLRAYGLGGGTWRFRSGAL